MKKFLAILLSIVLILSLVPTFAFASGMENEDPAGNLAGDLANDPTGDPANDPAGDPANDPAGDPANDPAGDPANDPAGDPANDPAGDPANDSANDPAEDPEEKPFDAAEAFKQLLACDEEAGRAFILALSDENKEALKTYITDYAGEDLTAERKTELLSWFEGKTEDEEEKAEEPAAEEAPKMAMARPMLAAAPKGPSFTNYGGNLSTPYGGFKYETGKRELTLRIYVNNSLVSTYYVGDMQLTANTTSFTVTSGSDYVIHDTKVTGGTWTSGSGTTSRKGTVTLWLGSDPWAIDIYLSAPHTVTVNYVYPDNSESNPDIETLISYTKKVYHGEEFKSNEWKYYDAADARNSYTATVKNETAGKNVGTSGTAWGGYYFKDTINADTTYTVTLNPTNEKDEPLAVDAYLYRGGNSVGFDRYMGVTFKYSGYNVSDKNGNDQVYILKDGSLVQPAASNNNIGDPTIIVQDNTQYKFYMSGLGLNLAQIKDVYYDSSDQNWYYIYRWVTDLDLIDISWTNTVGPIVIPPSESGRINFVYKEYESEHKLIYDANGGTGAPATQTKKTSQYVWNFTVTSGEPTRDGYVFLGWADTANATEPTYHGGSTIGVTDSKTIYAVWKQEEEIDKHVTLTPTDVIKPYDGNTYTAGTATAVDDAGNTVVIEYSADGSTWVADPSSIKATDVADSKVISVRASVPGVYAGYVTATQQLTIQPREVTVTGDGWTGDQPYTGTEYSKTTYSFSNVLDGQTATITYSISGKDIGSYTGVFGSDFKVMAGDRDVTANYTLTTKTPGTLTISAPETKELKYTVKYVVDSKDGEVLKSTEKTAEIPENVDTYSVTSVPSETFTGYKVKTEPTLPVDVEDGDTIYVIFEKDLSQTKDFLYYVNYVVDSKTGTVLEGPVENTVSVWINDTTYEVTEVENKTFTGYKKAADPTDPELPTEVEDGDTIYAIYVKDDSQTKKLSYTVQYITDDDTILDSEDKTVDIWVNDDTYEVTSVDSKTFPGYKVKEEPTLPTDVSDKDVISVVYEKDPCQTKKLTYTVNYVTENDDILDSEDITVDIWAGGDSYEVTEVEPRDFIGYVLKSNPTLPVVVKEGDEIFVIYQEHFGSLTISKKVTGELGDKNKQFSFKIEVDMDGGRFEYTTNTGVDGYVSNGGTIQLKHGESATIVGIPAGAKYSVTESGNSGYRVYASNDVGVIKLDETVTVSFTNSRSKVPSTGDGRNTGLWLCLMGVSFLGMAAAILPDGRKRRKPTHLKNR